MLVFIRLLYVQIIGVMRFFFVVKLQYQYHSKPCINCIHQIQNVINGLEKVLIYTQPFGIYLELFSLINVATHINICSINHHLSLSLSIFLFHVLCLIATVRSSAYTHIFFLFRTESIQVYPITNVILSTVDADMA